MFGYDPEVPAGFQDADIEMLEMAFTALDPNAWQCEYSSCGKPAVSKGVCSSHRKMELQEMEDARR
jgi:hypothetical protein